MRTHAVGEKGIHNQHNTGYGRSAYAAYGNAAKRSEE
jgi:hypothetical protein